MGCGGLGRVCRRISPGAILGRTLLPSRLRAGPASGRGQGGLWRGNAMLVVVEGCGIQSLTRLSVATLTWWRWWRVGRTCRDTRS